MGVGGRGAKDEGGGEGRETKGRRTRGRFIENAAEESFSIFSILTGAWGHSNLQTRKIFDHEKGAGGD